jgi:hypothetical protein
LEEHIASILRGEECGRQETNLKQAAKLEMTYSFKLLLEFDEHNLDDLAAAHVW